MRRSDLLACKMGAGMIEYHQTEIARNEADIRDIEAGDLRHYLVGPDGRLREETAYMLVVTRKSKLLHEQCLAMSSAKGCGAVSNVVARD